LIGIFVMTDCEIPLVRHLNSDKLGETWNWLGTDQPHLTHINLSNPEKYKEFVKSGWTDNEVIEYKLNSHGFRTDEFDNSPRVIVLGCSFTLGVGLHNYQTWPYLFSKYTNQLVWNLGAGSASIDTCYRILDNYLPYLNATSVILCAPDADRLEYYIKDVGFKFYTNKTQHSSLEEQWMLENWYGTDQHTYTLNYRKNLQAIQYLCYKKGIKFINFHRDEVLEKYRDHENDYSRCLIHLGPKTQDNMAQYAVDLFNMG